MRRARWRSSRPPPGRRAGLRHRSRDGDVTVPLKAFRRPSDEMNQHLYEAMKSGKFPESSSRWTVHGRRHAGRGRRHDDHHRQLAAGERPLTFTKGEQGVQIEGITWVELRAYGIEPPTSSSGC